MNRRQLFPNSPWAVAVILALGLGLCLASSLSASEDADAVNQAKSLSRAFRSAAKAVLPTVVKVTTQSHTSAGRGNPYQGTPLEDLFRGEGSGLGSGVIIDPSGIVLTNNHVVKGADKVEVQLPDGRVFEATDIKTDPQTDLAVMRIESDEPLPAAELGDSDKLDIGDWVIAIGNPFALESTVSAGIISAKGRSLDKVSRAQFLQTDAAINPGNSGGPLVNLDGQIIGINTAIFSQSGGYQGIGFAIPINLAKWVTPQLVESGSVKRAYLGISMISVTAENSEKFGVEPNQGVVVDGVTEDSPADQAGLLRGDVIVSLDDHDIRTMPDLQRLVERLEWGSEHQVKILRSSKPKTVKVVIREMPKGYGEPRSLLVDSANSYRSPELGLTVMELNSALARMLGYGNMSGVLINDVEIGGLAAQAGLQQGMVVSRVGDKPVSNVDEFKTEVEDASIEDGISILLHSPHGKKTVTLKRE